MSRAPQKRTLQTRAKLIAAAEALVEDVGYEALRVEEIVLRAGVAKGTFFAHFKDKDALLDILIGERINALLDDIEAAPHPETVRDVIKALYPLMQFMSESRYVYDTILRYSGAAAIAEIGPIAETFGRQIDVLRRWLTAAPFRKDISSELLAEGVQAFAIQAMALKFCALHASQTYEARLETYLNAWLLPPDG